MIRPATEADYPAFARLFPELRSGDRTPSFESWTGQIAPRALVVEEAGEIAGYLYFEILDGLGYVRHVVVDPRLRGRGHGLTLMRRVAERLRAEGIERWCLNVKPDNEPAVRLYERMGMRLEYASVALRMPWTILDRLPAPPPTVTVRPVVAEDDAGIESALSIPSGLLAQRRPLPGVRLLAAHDGKRAVGLAAFLPAFPGAYPFRARTRAVTRALLEAMRPHADPSRDLVQLVLEDAATLAHALESAGAVRHLEFVHFAGPVPAVDHLAEPS